MNLLDNSLDQANLRGVILEYPNQLDLGKKLAAKINLPEKKYQEILICGMGGSALAGDLLISYLNHDGHHDLPITICRSYDLPENTGKDTLIFIISYSGNTEETLSCFEQALKTKATVVALSKGGAVKELAQKNDVPYIELKFNFAHFEPRYAAMFIFITLHTVLSKSRLVKPLENFSKIDSRQLEIQGEEIAKRIKGKTPVIYATDRYELLARNWKIKINENSKTPAFWNYFPELNHNEMVGFTNPQADFYAIFLMEKDDHQRNKLRMKITAKLFKEKGVSTEIVQIDGNSFLEKIIKTLVLGDWVSYYLALEYNQDPSPVKMVEDLKKALG